MLNKYCKILHLSHIHNLNKYILGSEFLSSEEESPSDDDSDESDSIRSNDENVPVLSPEVQSILDRFKNISVALIMERNLGRTIRGTMTLDGSLRNRERMIILPRCSKMMVLSFWRSISWVIAPITKQIQSKQARLKNT